MTLISDNNLAKMRKTQELNLPETAYIQKLVSESDDSGGYYESWQSAGQAPARLGNVKGEQEREIAGQLGVEKVNVITLPADTEVDDTDRIQVNDVQYIVHWTNKNKSNLTALRVMVTEV